MEYPPATFSRVDRDVYISGYLPASDPEFIRSAGITRIVKMFADDVSYPGGYHRHPGVLYFVAPAEDEPDYDIRNDVVGAMAFIKEGLAAGDKILVHCHAGVSRSSTVVLVHLMVNRGLDLDAALRHLRHVRPCVQPNSGFMKRLQATDARLRQIRSKK